MLLLYLQLSDDTKRLEAELAEMTNKLNQQSSMFDEQKTKLETTQHELDLVKNARDEIELEKEEKSIKVLILAFRALSLQHNYDHRILNENIHRPFIGWGDVIDLPPLPPSPPPTPLLTPSRLSL